MHGVRSTCAQLRGQHDLEEQHELLREALTSVTVTGAQAKQHMHEQVGSRTFAIGRTCAGRCGRPPPRRAWQGGRPGCWG